MPSDPVKADDLQQLWTTYYANIFNPARIKLAGITYKLFLNPTASLSAILSGQVDHMVPRPGDHGILFEPIPVEQPAKAAS